MQTASPPLGGASNSTFSQQTLFLQQPGRPRAALPRTGRGGRRAPSPGARGFNPTAQPNNNTNDHHHNNNRKRKDNTTKRRSRTLFRSTGNERSSADLRKRTRRPIKCLCLIAAEYPKTPLKIELCVSPAERGLKWHRCSLRGTLSTTTCHVFGLYKLMNHDVFFGCNNAIPRIMPFHVTKHDFCHSMGCPVATLRGRQDVAAWPTLGGFNQQISTI